MTERGFRNSKNVRGQLAKASLTVLPHIFLIPGRREKKQRRYSAKNELIKSTKRDREKRRKRKAEKSQWIFFFFLFAHILIDRNPLVGVAGDQDGAGVGVDDFLGVPGLEVLQNGSLRELRQPGHVIQMPRGCVIQRI